MHRLFSFIVSPLLIVFLASDCVRYVARPIEPPAFEQAYRVRSLYNNPDLEAFFNANATLKPPVWPPPLLDIENLSLFAFYFSPELDEARSRLAAAEGAIITAGAKPNPSIAGAAGYTDTEESPYALRFGIAIPFETAGKRGYRIQRAQQLRDVDRFSVGETAWTVRSRIRATLIDHLMSSLEFQQRVAETQVRQEAVDIYEKRLEFGGVSRPDVTASRADLTRAQIEIEQLRGRVAETRAALEGAVGLPPGALSQARLAWLGIENPPSEEALDVRSIQRAGLLNRLDVQRLLAEYAAAESDLQLQVARQRPDISLGPSYSFGEANNSYTIGPALLAPLFDRNRGPIAEAEARRSAAGDRFLGAQAKAIDEMERGLIDYRSALREFQQADQTLTMLIRDREETTRRLLEAGEADRLALVEVRLEAAAAARLRLSALRHVYAAFGALEDSVQHPLPASSPMPSAPALNPRQKDLEGSWVNRCPTELRSA